MANKIATEMATNLTLDVSQAKSSLKELGQEVKSTNNAWKVQEAQMKSAGDAVGASKAKYDGLTDTVAKQKEKVDSLKTALGNVNTDTQKGKDLQTYLTAELAKAERQLNSYNGQLTKASESYKYQSSGLSKLNGDIQHNTEMTNANVKALEAEGKTNEANKAKLSGLQKTRESLNSILKIQQSELNKLSESGDKNSEAYKKQELRVAQMKAKIAEANKEIKTMNSRGIKLNTSSLDKTREKLTKMNEAINKSNHMFAKIFGANVLSSAFTNGVTSAKSGIVAMTHAGADFNKEQQVMGATWETLTGSAEKGQDMVKSINGMSKAFGQSNDVVNELQQQFYHVFNQKEPTQQLTGSMLTLADTLGMGSAEVERLGLNFTHMMTSSKLQLGDFNMISDQLPMYGEKLLEYEKKVQNNSNLTMSQLRDQMSAGKISADDATKVINELGDNYKSASENMLSTFTGMERRIKSQSKVLAGSITAPILATKSPLFKAVSNWVADDRTVALFGKFGDQLSKTFSTITAAFGKSFKSKDFETFANDTMVRATNAVARFGDYVSKHANDIVDLAKGIKAVGGSAMSTGGLMIKILVPALIQAGKFATKHKTTFKVLSVAIIGLGIAFKGTIAAMKGFTVINNGVKSFQNLAKMIKSTTLASKASAAATKVMTVAQKAFNAVLKANPLGIFLTVLTLVSTAFAVAYKKCKPFREFVDGLGKTVSQVFGKMGSFIGDVMGAIGKVISSACKGIASAWSSAWSGIASFFSSVWSGMKGVGSAGVKVVSTIISGEIKGLQVIWSGIWTAISVVFGSIWGGIKSVASGAMNGLKSIISGATSAISSVWNGAWHGIAVAFSAIWDGITSTVERAVDKVKSIIKGISDTVGKVGKSIGKLIPHFAMGGIVKENNQIVMVNDGTGPDWKELMHLPTGELMMSNQRNAIMPLPVGTRIYSGVDTKQIMDRQGIKKYATGGIVGSDSTTNISNVINNFKPSEIIPVSGVQESNGYGLLNQSASSVRSTPTSQQSSIDSSKLDQIISLLALILGVNKEQLAGSGSTGSLVGLYQQMSKDNAMRNWQRT
ncbi:hypothetical protein H7198_01610 [Fructobacillus sp. CRL 2054]|uniref:tape measure protein n=1 Tax=Fructobacillus sp. CRL 2054 TaxID=2763007 RepID=UPI002377DBCD|nr:tape measure protein [Fructobacillus sp. CRL 2054]MDD9138309.1 hypothetical protein [Fructobacillus sp. CRL 2054]